SPGGASRRAMPCRWSCRKSSGRWAHRRAGRGSASQPPGSGRSVSFPPRWFTPQAASPSPWSTVIVNDDDPEPRRLLAGLRPLRLVEFIRKYHVRFRDVIGVVDRLAEARL